MQENAILTHAEGVKRLSFEKGSHGIDVDLFELNSCGFKLIEVNYENSIV